MATHVGANAHHDGAISHDDGATSHVVGAGSHPSHQDDHGSHLSHRLASGGSHPVHEPPVAMTAVLVMLAIGSVFAGYIGLPHALGGHNALHAWLEPSFAAPGAEAVALEGAAPEGVEAAQGGLPEGEAAAEILLERTLMGVSSGIAILGILFAWYVWIKRREIADRAAQEYASLYRLLLNKYYVDELYDATIVQPIRVMSQEGLWRGFDVGVIDGIVNGTAAVVGASATTLRRLQTGSVRAYAGSFFVGVVAILGYYLWR